MRRNDWPFVLLILLGMAAGAYFGLQEAARRRPTVTVAAPDVEPLEPAPTVDHDWRDTDLPAAGPTTTNLQGATDAVRDHAPLLFRGPEGSIEIGWATNFDAVDAHCARKLLALVARRNAPGDYVRYREARFGATWAACPEMRR